MKTIEERAKEYAPAPFDPDEIIYTKKRYVVNVIRDAYIVGANAQKAIDDAKWLKIKSSWEREAQINHNDENNYQQGFHDAIEKACDWFDTYLMEIGYPDDWLRDSPNVESGKERFIKTMEE